MEKYDIAILGSGPGGYSAAMRAVDFGKNVCLIEANHLGGTGIMNGALTSKSMWELSKDYNVAGKINRGYRSSALSVDYKEVQKTILQAAKQRQLQMLSQIETFLTHKGNKGRIKLKYGTGQFMDRQTLKIVSKKGTEKIQADNFVIATGSRPRKIPEIEIDHERIITSNDIMSLKKFPGRMLIIGSGIIGCEYATIFSNYQQTEIHLLDRQNKVIPYEDNDLSDFVSESLEINGVKVHHTASLRTIRKYEDFLEVVLDYDDGHSKVLEVDVALVAIGRVPNIENLGLENVDIKPTEKGFLGINEICALEDFRSCNIFAVGDVTGPPLLYNVAELQGRYMVEALYDGREYPLNYVNMPTLMFFKPAIASVGLNERTCQKRGIPYRVAKYSNELVNRAIAMRSLRGFVKILISDEGKNEILGMRAAGSHASSFITSISYLIARGSSLKDVQQNIHPHPSVTEGIQECLRVFENKSIYKSEAFPEFISLQKWEP